MTRHDLGHAAGGCVSDDALRGLRATSPARQLLPLDPVQAREFALLQSVRDPFDRMIVAAARATGAPLITADTELHDLALVEVVWD